MQKIITSWILTFAIIMGIVTPAYAEHRRRPSKFRTAAQIGAGAAIGAGIGALIGDGRGAAAGALIGGGAMAGHALARRKSGYSSRTRTIGTIATGTAVGAGLGAAFGGGK